MLGYSQSHVSSRLSCFTKRLFAASAGCTDAAGEGGALRHDSAV